MKQPDFARALASLVAIALTTLAASPLAHAQTGQRAAAIEGRVIDARTGAALAKVSVAVSNGGPRTVTDGDGRFTLRVPAGRHRLDVSVVGYILVERDVDLTAGGSIALTIPLTEGTGTYTESVTVTGDVFIRTQPGVPSQQVLGSADIQNLRGVLADDPLRAVQVLPGVATGDDLRSEFSVRGSDFSHMNFTVEGFATPFLLHTVRAIEDRANSGSVAMINSDILEDVALLNGGYAQRHGNRTGAEVNFRLREGSRERRQVRLAVSGTNASAVFEGPVGKRQRGSWLVSARQSYIDLLIKRLDAEGLTFAFRDTQAKVVFDLTPRQRVEGVVIVGASRLEDVDVEEPSEKFTGRNRSAVGVVGWRFTTPKLLLTARTLAAHNEFRNDETSTVNLDEGETVQAGARADATLSLASWLSLGAGAQVERTRETRIRLRGGTVAQTINDYRGSATRSGAFAELRWTPIAAVTIVPGARVDHSDLTGETVGSPWLQAEWTPWRAFALRAGAGVYRQFPDFEHVIGMLSTPTNTHERATHYDLGVEGHLGETMRWQVAFYDREERDFLRRFGVEPRLEIVPRPNRVPLIQPVPGSSRATFVTRLDGHARGIEVLFHRRTPNGLSGWVSYAYGRNRYTDRLNGETFWGDLDQRHTVNVYGFYRLSERTSVTGKLRVGSNFPAPGYYLETDGRYVLVDRRNQLRLPLYARFDLRANRTFNWSGRRLTLFAELMNVLNRDNVRISRPRVNFTTREVRNMFEPMIPIVPSFGILLEL